jgi:hypothetical protein
LNSDVIITLVHCFKYIGVYIAYFKIVNKNHFRM